MRAWILAVVLLLVPARALAEPKVAVTGEPDAGVRKAVQKALDKNADIVDEADAAAVVRIAVVRGKKKWTAVVTAVQTADGKTIGRYEVKAKKKKLAKAAAAKAWAKLGKALRKARKEIDEDAAVATAEPEPEPAPAAEPAAEPEPAAAAQPEPAAAAEPAAEKAAPVAVSTRTVEKRGKGEPWLELSAEGRPFLRTLRYTDDIMGRLRRYDLAAPAAGVTATWTPLPRGALGFLSLHGEVELAVGVNGSKTSDGTEYPTSASEWTAGLRGDFPIAGWRWTLDAAYGEHRFAVEDDEMASPLVPDVAYRWARGGLGVAIPLGATLAIGAGAGWRQLLSTGDLGSDEWFPRLTGNGIDAELGATWRVGGPVSLHARADLRRYFFAMNPEVGDPLIAGGAIDQYLALVTGLSIALR